MKETLLFMSYDGAFGSGQCSRGLDARARQTSAEVTSGVTQCDSR